MLKYIIWKNNEPIATEINPDVRMISNWVYDRILDITGSELLAIEVSSWSELAVEGESYDMSEHDLKLTVSRAD